MKWTLSIVLAMLMIAPAVAVETTMIFGDEFAGVDVGIYRAGPIEFSAVAAVDYFVDQSSIVKNFKVTVKDNYVGPALKCHFLPVGSTIDPYVGAAYLIRNSRIRDDYIVLEAGVIFNFSDDIGIGCSYVYSEDFRKKEQLMVRIPIRW